jgi:hypothetical protein
MKLRPEKTGDEACFSAELLRKIVSSVAADMLSVCLFIQKNLQSGFYTNTLLKK